MHPRVAVSTLSLVHGILLCCAVAGCSRGLTPAMPDEHNETQVTKEPAPVTVTYTHEPALEAPRSSITKVTRHQNYLVEFGDYQAEIDPEDGGRIVAFRLSGQNALLEKSASPDAYGSSFWPSPQSAWRWPPPFEFDRLGWTASVGDDRLTLESLTNPELGLGARQVLFGDAKHEALVIEYSLENRGNEAIRVAPWQNTRLPPGGLTFFPSQQGTLPPSSLSLRPDEGVVWMQHDPASAKEGKAFADGEEGWLANLHGDLLFVKVFPNVPRERQAPEEAEIEIYVHGSGRFVEVEQQGEYGELAPGSTSRWTVRWLLANVPTVIPHQPGQQLLEYTRKLVQSARPE